MTIDSYIGLNENWKRIEKGNKYGLVNSEGVLYDVILRLEDGLVEIRLNEKWDLIDTTGQEIVAPKYEFACRFSKNFIIVVVNGKLGLINRQGDFIAKCKHDEIRRLSDSITTVLHNGEYGFINADGKEVVSTKYDSTEIRPNYHCSIIKLRRKYGLLDISGRKM